MMKRLVEFPLQEGGTLLVEVDEPEGYAETTTRGGVVKAARPSEIADKAKDTFEDALDKIKPAAQAIISTLRGLHDEPDEIGVEFGLKLKAEAGAFLASAGAEANYTVTMKWVKTQPQKKAKKAYRVS
jgi:hypothetical protein